MAQISIDFLKSLK